jgi:thiamine biosynthesis protein ThiI
MAQDIGTFTTSILPDQDCCTLFVPKHPETKADLDTVLRLEEALAVDDMVKEAVENTERRHFASPGAAALAR